MVWAIGSNLVETVPLVEMVVVMPMVVVVVGSLVLVEEQSAGTQVSSSSL